MLRIGRRKRQGLCPSADISSNDLRFGGLVMSMNSIAVLTSGGDAPVSYTHLDVYKRQALNWTRN